MRHTTRQAGTQMTAHSGRPRSQRSATRFTKKAVAIAACCALGAGILALPATSVAEALPPVRVSVPDASTGGTLGNNDSRDATVSDDGRYVGFTSDASNLVLNDTNGGRDAFVFDRATNTTTRVSVPDASTGQTQATGVSTDISVKGDGDVAAFVSGAANLVSGDNNRRADVFVRDVSAGTTERASIDVPYIPNGWAGWFTSYVFNRPHLAGDGRYVGFEATKKTWGIPQWTRVFVRDRELGSTEMISVTDSGATASNFNFGANMTPDGRYAAFTSNASNLHPSTSAIKSDVYVRDRVAGTTTLVSHAVDGTGGDKNSVMSLSNRGHAMTADGRYVVFRSQATNLIDDDTNNAWDAFIYDRQTQTHERVSVPNGNTGEADGQSQVVGVSFDGRYVAYQSMATNLVEEGDDDGYWDAYVTDRSTQTTTLLSKNAAGEPANSHLLDDPVLAYDGSVVAYMTAADNLDPADTNGVNDIYLNEIPSDEPDVTGSIAQTSDLVRGEQGTFDVSVQNTGVADAAGPISASINVPDGLSLVSALGSGWSCAGAECSYAGSIPASSALPDITVTAAVDADAADIVTASATVACTCSSSNTLNDTFSTALIVTDPPSQGDLVRVDISGALSWSVDDVATSGDLTVSGGGNTFAVSGTVNVPSPAGGGDAAVTLNVSKASSGIVSGSLSVSDPHVPFTKYTPWNWGSFGMPHDCRVTGSRTWYLTNRWPWRSYNVSFDITDVDCVEANRAAELAEAAEAAEAAARAARRSG